MSGETWKAEFYPVEARDVPCDPVEATKHSLRKWQGLREANCEKHEVVASRYSVREVSEDETLVIGINNLSCALCRHYFGQAALDECKDCPLAQARAGVSCTERMVVEARDPWRQWTSGRNPEPMIEWLEITLERLEKQGK